MDTLPKELRMRNIHQSKCDLFQLSGGKEEKNGENSEIKRNWKSSLPFPDPSEFKSIRISHISTPFIKFPNSEVHNSQNSENFQNGVCREVCNANEDESVN